MVTSPNNSRDLAVVDATTGEILAPGFTPIDIIPQRSLSPLLSRLYDGSQLPIHIQMLEQSGFDDETLEFIVNAYEGAETVPLKKWIMRNQGKDTPVLGMRIYEHGPYVGKDGEQHEGFFQIQILLDQKDDEGRCIVLRSSSTTIATHTFYAIRKHGWHLFDQPITYRFSVGESGAHFMYNTANDAKRSLGKK